MPVGKASNYENMILTVIKYVHKCIIVLYLLCTVSFYMFGMDAIQYSSANRHVRMSEPSNNIRGRKIISKLN